MALPIFQRTVVDDAGNVLAGATVTVTNESTGLAATIYSDRNGSVPLTNPFTTGSDGLARFYAAAGEYRIQASLGGTSVDWRYQVLTGTAAQYDVIESPTDSTPNRVMTTGAHPMIMSIDPYRKSIEHASGGRNTVIYDAQGNPNIMVVVPRFNYEDLPDIGLNLGTGTPTAFLTNGVPRSEILISKFLNSTMGSGVASVGGGDPRTSVTFDTARSLCAAKGAGWHLMSQHELEAIKFWCLANGTIPMGNTNYGRSHVKKWQVATRNDGKAPGDTSGYPKTFAGMGPVEWSHDHTEYGIMDPVGNVWEWVDQFKLIDGRIYCTPDNQPDLAESSWTAQDAYFDGATGTPKLSGQITSQSDGSQYSYTSLASNMTVDPSYTQNELMRRLGIEQDVATTDGGLWVRNVGERLPLRGGDWNGGSDAGLGALSLYAPRSNSYSYIGFRSAFFA
jgi:hypothetical protein